MIANSNMPEETKTATKPKTHKRRMRWFLAIIYALWIFTAMTATILVFYLTQSPLSFLLFATLAPPVYLSYHLAKYSLPMGKREYKLRLRQFELRLAALNKDTINNMNTST